MSALWNAIDNSGDAFFVVMGVVLLSIAGLDAVVRRSANNIEGD